MFFFSHNFEMEPWAYKIIQGSSGKIGECWLWKPAPAFSYCRLMKKTGKNKIISSIRDIWLDLDNAQKIVDNIASSFGQKGPAQQRLLFKKRRPIQIEIGCSGSKI